jgi:hypothetical protein
MQWDAEKSLAANTRKITGEKETAHDATHIVASQLEQGIRITRRQAGT